VFDIQPERTLSAGPTTQSVAGSSEVAKHEAVLCGPYRVDVSSRYGRAFGES
jgi:hypothetical protein